MAYDVATRTVVLFGGDTSKGSLGVGWTLAILASLAAGAWNGLLVAVLEVQPIVATLILMVAGRGVAQLLSNGQIITFENKTFEFLSQGAFLTLPFTVTIVAVMTLTAGAILAIVVLHMLAN